MKVAIIGAGKMGRLFARIFIDEGDSVIVSSRDAKKLLEIRDNLGVKIANNINAVKNADRVFICVPMENLEEVAREIHPYVRPNQVIMDICSLKEDPVKIMHKYIKTGITLGTHPVFGPGAKSLKNQNFVLTPINTKERKFAKDFKIWLEERQANVFVMSPRKHDELMSVVLGLPHFIGLVICDTLLSYDSFLDARKVAGASYKILLTFAEAVASEETGFYADLQMDLPEIERIEGLFLKKSEEWFNTVRRKKKSEFANKMEIVKKKLRRINPDYARSYKVLHEMLSTIESSSPQ